MNSPLLKPLLWGWIIIMTGCTSQRVQPHVIPTINLVPKPVFMEPSKGTFKLTRETRILFDRAESGPIADYLIDQLQPATGYSLKKSPLKGEGGENTISLRLCGEGSNTGIDLAWESREAYALYVTPAAIELWAHEPAGLFYAVQTLRQLFPAAIESPVYVPATQWTVPAVTIRDAPRYPWRGMMLDVSRHFFDIDYVKEFIDNLAMHKLNRFHWHLVDDQGWRVEIKKFPKLMEVGAWRVNREHLHWNAREKQQPGEQATYGGFYTQEEIQEIVDYALSRCITIVPEIEMPAHVTSALAAYPELSCSGGPFTVLPGGIWPITDIYCAGNDQVFTFLEQVLDEVIALFPGEFIHVGGDEATKTEWKRCAKCQNRIRTEGLKNEEELQSYFIKRMERYILSKGRKLMGWDEILEGGLASEAAVMSWRGMEGGIEAAKQGHAVVMSPTSHCYFDYYQGDPDLEPLAIGGFLPLKKVYSFDPSPAELTEDQARFILGGQANLWTEYIATPLAAQYMIFPRIAALAEAVWSQKNDLDWNDFSHRLVGQLARYEAAGILYAKSAFQATITAGCNMEEKELEVVLETEIPLPHIRYTLDGSDPTAHSTLYTKPFTLNLSKKVKAGAFLKGKLQGKIVEKAFHLHKAVGMEVVLTHPCNPRYPGGGSFCLTNCLKGSKNFRDGSWQGFDGVDLEAVIDLGEETTLTQLSTGFLQHVGVWIFMPTEVQYALSMDGNHYTEVATVKNNISEKVGEPIIKQFHTNLDEIKARYIKVVAKNRGTCPSWHAGAGGKAWIFADEIVVY